LNWSVAEQQRVALDERETLLLQERVGALLAVQPVELRLAIEHVERRRRALHVQVDHVPRARCERRPRLVAEHVAQRDRPERQRRAAEEAAAAQAQILVVHRHHRLVTNSSRFMTTPASTCHAANS
jgi:hypothetical protein